MSRIPKPGRLAMRWKKSRVDSNYGLPGDLEYAWGEPCTRRDGGLLHYVFTGELPGLGNGTFAKELIARGYDITTLRFSIQKLAASPEPTKDTPNG